MTFLRLPVLPLASAEEIDALLAALDHNRRTLAGTLDVCRLAGTLDDAEYVDSMRRRLEVTRLLYDRLRVIRNNTTALCIDVPSPTVTPTPDEPIDAAGKRAA